jgi:cell division protease FtsH
MNAKLRNFAIWLTIVLLLLVLFMVFRNPGQRSIGDVSAPLSERID